MELIQLLSIGLVAGVVSGLFGVGGGLVIVPALVFILHFKLKMAIGTSLGALLLPVGLLGVWEYYKSGNVNIKFSLLIALGLFIGAYFGAKIVQPLSPVTLRKIYAGFLIFVAAKMLLGR